MDARGYNYQRFNRAPPPPKQQHKVKPFMAHTKKSLYRGKKAQSYNNTKDQVEIRNYGDHKKINPSSYYF